MKRLSLLLVGAVALMSFTACSSSEDDSSESKEYKEEKKAADNATFSSHDDGISISGDTIFVSFSADGGEVTIDVDCEVSWRFLYNSISSTLSCYTYTSNSVTIKAEQNSTIRELTSTIYLRTLKSGITFATIVITQEAPEAYLILSEEELFLSSVGNDVKVNVETNCYTWKCVSDADWLTAKASTSSGYMTISYTNNETGAEREGYVTVYGYKSSSTYGDAATVAELKVTQSSENFDALILEYTLTSNNQSIELPLHDAKNVTIDWDDGEVTTFTSNSKNSSLPTHTYSTPGKYQVSINGVVGQIYNYNNKSKSYLTAIVQWGNTGLTSLNNAFYECENIISLPENTREAFANVTTFYRAFYGCPLTTLPENLFSDCSSATNFSYAFYNCTSLESLPKNLFSGCPSATDFSYAFYGCTSLESLPEGMFADCSSATDFGYVFRECTSLKSISTNLFAGCTSAKDFSYAFYGCTSLELLPEGMFSGCTSATDFGSAFRCCTSLTTVPENMFYDCSSVTDFSCTFDGCTNLTNVPSFEGLSRVTSFSGVFLDCSSLTWITKNIFAGCTSVTTFANAFYNCSSLKSIPATLFDDCMLVSNFSGTFYGCSSVSGESPYMEMEVDGENVKIHIYERPSYAVSMRWVTPETYGSCFKNSTFSDIESIPSSWK